MRSAVVRGQRLGGRQPSRSGRRGRGRGGGRLAVCFDLPARPCRHRASVDFGSLHPEPAFIVCRTRLYRLQDPPLSFALSESFPLSEPAFIFVPNTPVFMGLCQVRQSCASACAYQYPSRTRTGIGLVGDGLRPAPVGAAQPSPLHPSSRAESSDQAGKSDCPPNRVRQPDLIARCRHNPLPPRRTQKFSVVARAAPHVYGNRARGDLGIGSDSAIPPPAPPSRVNAAPDPPRRPIARPDPARIGGRHGLIRSPARLVPAR